MKSNFFLSLTALFLLPIFSIAQPSLLNFKNKSNDTDFRLVLNPKNECLATLRFAPSKGVDRAGLTQWLKDKLELRNGLDELRDHGHMVQIKNGMRLEKVQQFFHSLKVLYGQISFLTRNEKVSLINFEFFSIPADFSVRPSITKADAFAIAKIHLGERLYSWENQDGMNGKYKKPEGELVILPLRNGNNMLKLCYQFNIFSLQPHSYKMVFVDAASGAVINDIEWMPTCNQIKNDLTNKQEVSIHDSVHLFSPNPQINNEISNAEKSFVKSNKDAAHGNHDYLGFNRNNNFSSFDNAINASGNTRYSGMKSDVQTSENFALASPYVLRALPFDFRHNVVTLNYQKRRTDDPIADELAVDFSDNDNVWTEHDDTTGYRLNITKTGFDVHFNMQLVSDYLLQRQGWNSWNGDNLSGEDLVSYVNATIAFTNGVDNDNAFWSHGKKAMYFGCGTYSQLKPAGNYPVTSLDIAAHELGHAVCDALIQGPDANHPGLAYEGESGAMNEGFSDIWAICTESYYNEKFPIQVSPPKDKWIIAEEIDPRRKGFRNFKFPDLSPTPAPDTYLKDNWHSITPTTEANDFGGVHTNSSILVKWFSLIAEGGNDTNDNLFDYKIEAIGIRKAELLAFAMEGLLTYDADYFTAKEVAIGVAESMSTTSGPEDLTEADLKSVKMAWVAVGLDSMIEVYDMMNTSEFLTNTFTSIGVGKDGHVWAGTNKKGLYKFNGDKWVKLLLPISDYDINSIASDKLGGIWISESGRESELNAGGGIFHFPDTILSNKVFYDTIDGIKNRNPQGLFVDKMFGDLNSPGRVWAAHLPGNGINEIFRGGLSHGPNPDHRFNHNSFGITFQEGGLYSIGGDNNEIWAFSKLSGPGDPPANQILRYNAQNGNFIAPAELISIIGLPIVPNNFEANAIYFDIQGNKWIGKKSGGLIAKKTTADFVTINFPKIFPGNIVISHNAITGDKDSVYIGTDSGLIVYGGKGIFTEEHFNRFTTKHGLPSNKINAICTDSVRGGIWLATDKGIAFMKRPNYKSNTMRVTVEATDMCERTVMVSLQTSTVFSNAPVVNKFTVELSDEYGAFDHPQLLDVITSTDPGLFLTGVNLTSITKRGYYKIRVKSTNPKMTAVSDVITIFLNPAFTDVDAFSEKKIVANKVCTEGEWNHYYDDNGTPNDNTDDNLLLSLKPNGNNLGSLSDHSLKLTIGFAQNAAWPNAAYRVSNPQLSSGLWSMNRYWEVSMAQPPTSLVGIRFYYTDADLRDVNASINNGPINHKDLVFYGMKGPSLSPTNQFSGCSRIQSLLNIEGVDHPGYTWKYTNLGMGTHMAEFELMDFNGGGAGRMDDEGPLNAGNIFTLKSGNWDDPGIWSNHKIPDLKSQITLFNDVNINVLNADCKSMNVVAPAKINVASGANLEIH